MAAATSADHASLERGRLVVVLATVAINVIGVSLLAFAPWSDWRTGVALNFIDNSLLIGFALVRRDALLGRFLLFGLVVGLTELAADAWLVDYTRTLDYSLGGGPMIWRSPIWMPLAWEVVAVQFGYIGLRLWERFGRNGLLLIAIMGAVNIPFYEQMARKIHWWQYSGCRMLSFTPWYVIVGEFGIALALALLARTLRRGSWGTAVAAGVAGGLSIFICYAGAFLITDGLPRQLSELATFRPVGVSASPRPTLDRGQRRSDRDRFARSNPIRTSLSLAVVGRR